MELNPSEAQKVFGKAQKALAEGEVEALTMFLMAHGGNQLVDQLVERNEALRADCPNNCSCESIVASAGDACGNGCDSNCNCF